MPPLKEIVKELLSDEDFFDNVKDEYEFRKERGVPTPLENAVEEALYDFFSQRFTEIEEVSPTIWEYVKKVTAESVKEALSSAEYYKKRKRWGGPDVDRYISDLLGDLSKDLEPEMIDKLREKKYKKKLEEEVI